nr:MAG TPA: hypothetical protein [Caudoviricetes sp.]
MTVAFWSFKNKKDTRRCSKETAIINYSESLRVS